MKYTKAELAEKLSDMGIPVVKGAVARKDVARALASFAEEELSSKLTQLGGLYNIKLAIQGEKNPSSSDRLVEYIKMNHGQSAIDALSAKSHSELRSELSKYDLVEIRGAQASVTRPDSYFELSEDKEVGLISWGDGRSISAESIMEALNAGMKFFVDYKEDVGDGPEYFMLCSKKPLTKAAIKKYSSKWGR